MIPLSKIERSEFSQNGEDGIINWLVSRLKLCHKMFVEIGSGSGKQNNTTWLVMKGWAGVVIDRRIKSIENYKKRGFKAVIAHALEVSPENAGDVLMMFSVEPDLFSIDIDSFDFVVLKRFMILGFRPQIIVCEYNSKYGDDDVVVLWTETAHKISGCSLSAWKRMLGSYGYEFVTVESRRVNAFFVRQGSVNLDCLKEIDWLEK